MSIPLTKVFKPIGRLFKRPTPTHKLVETELTLPYFYVTGRVEESEPNWSDPEGYGGSDYWGRPRDNDTGGGSTGGGGAGSFDVYQIGKHRIPGFRNMEPQIPGNCVPSIIAKVMSSLCNTPTTYLQVLTKYFQLHPEAYSDVRSLLDGVPMEHLGSLIDEYLNQSVLEKPQWQLLGVLQGGTPIMVGFINPGTNIGHNMLITGWQDNGNTLILLDPETGSETTMRFDDVRASALYLKPVSCK